MTEFEKGFFYKLIEDIVIKFSIRYVDDALLIIKRSDIAFIVNK